jgi:hypothetical protein
MYSVMSSQLSHTKESSQVRGPCIKLYFRYFNIKYTFSYHVLISDKTLTVFKMSISYLPTFVILVFCLQSRVFSNTHIFLCIQFSFIRNIKSKEPETRNQFYSKTICTSAFFFKICHAILDKSNYCTYVLHAETQFAYHWIRSISVQQVLTCNTKQTNG